MSAPNLTGMTYSEEETKPFRAHYVCEISRDGKQEVTIGAGATAPLLTSGLEVNFDASGGLSSVVLKRAQAAVVVTIESGGANDV